MRIVCLLLMAFGADAAAQNSIDYDENNDKGTPETHFISPPVSRIQMNTNENEACRSGAGDGFQACPLEKVIVRGSHNSIAVRTQARFQAVTHDSVAEPSERFPFPLLAYTPTGNVMEAHGYRRVSGADSVMVGIQSSSSFVVVPALSFIAAIATTGGRPIVVRNGEAVAAPLSQTRPAEDLPRYFRGSTSGYISRNFLDRDPARPGLQVREGDTVAFFARVIHPLESQYAGSYLYDGAWSGDAFNALDLQSTPSSGLTFFQIIVNDVLAEKIILRANHIVTVADDSTVEGEESVTLRLSNWLFNFGAVPAAFGFDLRDVSATFTILANDGPQYAIAGPAPAAEVVEGATLTVVVQSDASVTDDVLCTIIPGAGSGASADGNDFLAATATAVFTAQTTASCEFAVVVDYRKESVERFAVALSAPAGGGALGATYGVARDFRIADFVLPLTITGSERVLEGGVATYTVSLSMAAPIDVVVRWQVGTATGTDGVVAADFADDVGMQLARFPSGTVIIRAGTTGTTFSVYVFDDQAPEYAEQFSVGVSGDAVAASSAATIIGLSDGMDHDRDNDGLIDVTTTTQLSAIRHDLGGAGLASVSDANRDAYLAAFPFFDERRTCPSTCTGYELSNDIDLAGTDWVPIGGGVGTSFVSGSGLSKEHRYKAVFEGNGHVISNMELLSPNNVWHFAGLFRVLDGDGVIRNVGLRDVNLNIGQHSVHTGALVGRNDGKVAACYVIGGRVYGAWGAGGLAGSNFGKVIASYANVEVDSRFHTSGGLIGEAGVGSVVSASYSIGVVKGGSHMGDTVRGGLLGRRDTSGAVATDIQASYFDNERSGQSGCCGGANVPSPDNSPKTSNQLRAPTTAGTIYEGWDKLNVDGVDQEDDGDLNDDAPWDFGTFYQYPVLVFGDDADSRAAQRTSQQQAQPAVVLTPTLGGSETVSEGEAASYVVRLPGVLPAGVGASWDWSVGGTEIGAADFAGTSRGSVVIAPGGSSASFFLTAAVDGVAELDEAFEVTMSNARLTGAPDDVTLDAPSTVARTTIAANEFDQVTVAVAPVVVAEGTTATFTVTLSGGAGWDVTVEYELTTASEGLTSGDLSQVTVIDRGGTNYVSVNALPITGSITLREDGTAEVGVSVVADEVEKESSERFRLTLTNCPNCGSEHLAEIGEPKSAEARIRSERGFVVAAGVYLEGAYRVADGDMGTFLNRALPRVQPYSVRPWNHAATTTVPRIEGVANANGMPSNVVDWMLLELRVVNTGSAPSAADPDSVPVGGVKAGLILSDGSIVGVNENATTTTDVLARQGVRFDAEIEPNKDVYLLLQHRNHLPILSARPLSTDCGDSSANYCIDYREVGASTDLYNGSCPMFRNNDRLFMITGDVNADGTIVSADADFANEALRLAAVLQLQATNNPASFRILRFRGTEFYMPSANVSLDEFLVSSDFERVVRQLRRPSGSLTRGRICRSSEQ